jgi:hypothetical protein
LPVPLFSGRQVLEVPIPAVTRETELEVKRVLDGKSMTPQPVAVKPVRFSPEKLLLTAASRLPAIL